MDKEAEFLKYLTENISTESQKDKFIRLINRDADKITESIRETIINKKEDYIHEPYKILDILKLFREENILKKITHKIEPTSMTFKDFLKELEDFKYKNKIITSSLYELNYNTYLLFKNALLPQKNNDNKQNWMFWGKSLFISLKFLNFEENTNIIDLFNKRVDKEEKFYSLKVVYIKDYFHKIFANTIRFRSDLISLKKCIEYIFKEVYNDDNEIFEFNIDFSEFEEYDINIITNCIYNSISIIKEMIINYHKENNEPIIENGKKHTYKINIKIILKQDKNFYLLEIIHLKSKPKNFYENQINAFVGGNTSSIITNLLNICDFSYKFESNKINYEIDLLKQGTTKFTKKDNNFNIDKSCLSINILKEKIEGFTYSFKLYQII